MDSARRLQPATLGVREDCRGARAGEVLRRQPARLANRRRPADRCGALRACRSCSSPSSPTSAPRSHCFRSILAVAYLAGLPMRILGILALAGILVAPVAWKFALKDYQKSRILTFIDPSKDQKGAGYQQIQARITVGSGGMWGKGFMKGTQGQLRFLPVAHNDFIFSALGRGTGLRGRHRGPRAVSARHHCARCRRRACRRTGSGRISSSASWRASLSRCSTTSRCPQGWRP